MKVWALLLAGLAIALTAPGAQGQPAWTTELARIASEPGLLDLPIPALNKRLNGLFHIEPAAEGGCAPPHVDSGTVKLSQWAVLARHGDACEQRDGLQMLSVSIGLQNGQDTGEAFGRAVTQAAGPACYEAVDSQSTIRFWVLPDRLISVAFAGSVLTISLVNETLAQSESNGERQTARQFNQMLLGHCGARRSDNGRDAPTTSSTYK